MAEERYLEWINLVVHQWIHAVRGKLGAALILSGRGSGTEDLRDSADSERGPAVTDLLNDALAFTERLAQVLPALGGSGDVPYRAPVPVEPRRAVESTIAAIEQASPTGGSRIHLVCDRDLPYVSADPYLLDEILHNLISNALRATDATQAEVRVNLSRVLDDTVRYDIEDNGPGIEPGILSSLFDRPLANEDREGLGVGLFVASRLAHMWGGSLTLVRTDSSGTQLRLDLPVATEEELSSDRDVVQTGSAGEWFGSEPVLSTSPSLDAGRALVVDDQPEWLAILADAFRARGFEVDLASTIDGAENLLGMGEYDVCVFDLRLSGSSSLLADQPGQGFDLAREARVRHPGALILILTGLDSSRLVREAFRAGVDDVITKAGFGEERLDEALTAAQARREAVDLSVREAYLDALMNETMATIAHELASPITAMLRNSEILAAEVLGPLTTDQRRTTRDLIGAAQRASQLITGHLEVTQIERQLKPLVLQQVDVALLVREEIATHEFVRTDDRVTLSGPHPSEAVVATVDPERVRLAIKPLIENATRFSPPGGTVWVEVRSAGGAVEVSIRDTGPGMSMTEVDRLLSWTPGGPTRKPSPRVRSSGLGLRISKRIVELHRGNLRVSSSTDGTTVVLSFGTTTG